MDKPETKPVPRPSVRRFWPFALVPLAALVWLGFTARMPAPQTSWQQKLDDFRNDGSADASNDANPRMADLIILRNAIVNAIGNRQSLHLTPAQDRLLTASLTGPVDESSQSEALDTLKLAHRAGFLSPAQTQKAVEECLTILSRTPPPMVRLEGARFLSHSQSPQSKAALQRLLRDPIPKIRDAAKKGLEASLPVTPP